MAYSHYRDYPTDILDRAAGVRLACFDVDGTLTDGGLHFDTEGRETKVFNVHDGQGLSLLRKYGIEVAFVTARPGAIAERRGRELGATTHEQVKDKLACVRQLAHDQGIGLDAVSFMGDDLADLAVLQAAGLSVAPCDAHPWIRERVHWRTLAGGGRGAARELCDLLLAAQGHVEALLE